MQSVFLLTHQSNGCDYWCHPLELSPHFVLYLPTTFPALTHFIIEKRRSPG